MIEKHIRIFEKGLWKYDYVLDNYMDRFSQIKKYEYNAQNQIVSIKEGETFDGALSPYQDFFYEKGKPAKFSKVNTGTDKASENVSTFIYDKNGKLSEIKPSNPRFHWQYKYQYKSDGTPSVIEIFDNGKLSNRNIITSYQDEKNYTYTYENYSTTDGKKVFELKESLVNGQRPMRKDAWIEGKDQYGNVIRIRENHAVLGKFYYSRKLTYTKGETTGSTEYNPYFTEGINGDISQLPENKTPKSTYKVRLAEDGKFKMESQANAPAPDLNNSFISPNKTDFIYFDPYNGEVAIAENMKPSADFSIMKPYNTPSKKYIVINTDYQFIIFENGKQIDTSGMKISQDMNNLVVSENNIPKYFIPNFDKLTFLKFYPLYILAL